MVYFIYNWPQPNIQKYLKTEKHKKENFLYSGIVFHVCFYEKQALHFLFTLPSSWNPRAAQIHISYCVALLAATYSNVFYHKCILGSLWTWWWYIKKGGSGKSRGVLTKGVKNEQCFLINLCPHLFGRWT